MINFMSTRTLYKIYSSGYEKVIALNNVSVDIYENEVLGIIGESGSGKSTLARLFMGLEEPDMGQVHYRSKVLDYKNKPQMRRMKNDVQMVFQDAAYALNPIKRIDKMMYETIKLHHKKSKAEAIYMIERILSDVGLKGSVLGKYPGEFSGGERQRLNIAKALLVEPKLLICDEPVSALDISVQAKILNLLMAIKDEYQLTYLFIAHSLDVIHHVSDRIGVMKDGQLVELDTCDKVIHEPQHGYTKHLLSHRTVAKSVL
ncbi:MAG: dipeptide/oligopeptide/nickel ABC transporter ATP-binding protein [Vallitaleaceae bacterium]|jgi:ABC-type dipeptide/oligopeptide/nickel transport system ATPase subunit|nr:dipeptide/oligopeptide/nickel ABC transporter ATP-binding protein [Vallitaleaceae bacterium]